MVVTEVTTAAALLFRGMEGTRVNKPWDPWAGFVRSAITLFHLLALPHDSASRGKVKNIS
jgi:hypothetical protein